MKTEIYMQYLEHNGIYDILIQHKITAYFRYVDEIHSQALIVQDGPLASLFGVS
jgi:hypothetical protein